MNSKLIKPFVLGAIAAYGGAALVLLSAVKLGVLPVQADVAPSRLEAKLLGSALHAAVARHAPSGPNPMSSSEENLIAGAKVYRDMCLRCHGGSRESDNSYGRSFYPPAPQLPLTRTSYTDRAHECYYADNVAGVSSTCLLVQPHNHGTAAAIAYGLTRVGQTDPLGIVAFFPSDHHFANEEAFITYVDCAFIQAKSHPERVILLGIEPEAAEEAYGWIEPVSPLAGGSSTLVSEVNRFWEKPPRRVASRLMRRGCLWNCFVMVGTVGAFRNLIQHTLPDLLSCFESMPPVVVPGREYRVLGEIYHKLPPADFSAQVLSARPSNLAVICGRGLGWSDLGDPERAPSVLNHTGLTSKAEAYG